jgi:hypothetical protein
VLFAVCELRSKLVLSELHNKLVLHLLHLAFAALFCEVTLDNKFQKKFFVSVMNMLLIYLFASVELEKGHKSISWL